MSAPEQPSVVDGKETLLAEVVVDKCIPRDVGSDEESAFGDEHGFRSWAELKADRNVPCYTCEEYLAMLVRSVDDRLVQLLRREPAVGGVSLQGALYQQAPLTIDGDGRLQTTKEHWRWDNCRMSLTSKQIYEAPGTLFWLSKAPPSWGGELLPAATMRYQMMGGGRLVWSDEKFMRSSDDPLKRRYSIRFAIPHHPIIGSLFVGLLACLLDCWLVRWFAG
jgi:hypothetical protein